MKKPLLLNLLTLFLLVFTTSAFSQTIFLVESPTNLAGSYDFTDSFTADGWGADLDTTAISALGVFAYDDGSYVDPVNGASGDSATCGPVINGSEIDGKVAFLYRGACNFSLKAYQAQAAGAVGCVIINNEPGNLINMLAGDSAEAIHIPVIFISDADGALLRDSIMDGGTTVFIGNPNGVFTNNVGAYTANISTPNSLSIPTSFPMPFPDLDIPNLQLGETPCAFFRTELTGNPFKTDESVERRVLEQISVNVNLAIHSGDKIHSARRPKAVDVESPSMLAYPNPTVKNEPLFITLNKSSTEVAIFELTDMMGNLVLNGQLDDSQSSISREKLASGMYNLRVRTDTFLGNQTIVVQ